MPWTCYIGSSNENLQYAYHKICIIYTKKMSYDSHSLSVKDMIHIFFQANCMVSYNWYRELYDFDSYASCIKDDTMNQASWNLSLYHNRPLLWGAIAFRFSAKRAYPLTSLLRSHDFDSYNIVCLLPKWRAPNDHMYNILILFRALFRTLNFVSFVRLCTIVSLQSA